MDLLDLQKFADKKGYDLVISYPQSYSTPRFYSKRSVPTKYDHETQYKVHVRVSTKRFVHFHYKSLYLFEGDNIEDAMCNLWFHERYSSNTGSSKKGWKTGFKFAKLIAITLGKY
jgi:hypothetical protein